MNRTELSAAIIERKVLRYSPAGIAILDFTLKHGSMQLEAGQMRQVEAEIKSVAIGPLANELNQVSLEPQYGFTGFLARRTRNTSSVVFHVTSYQVNTD